MLTPMKDGPVSHPAAPGGFDGLDEYKGCEDSPAIPHMGGNSCDKSLVGLFSVSTFAYVVPHKVQR